MPNADSGDPRLIATEEPPKYPRRGFVVTGPYRSGTSLVSQLLFDLGVNFGPQDAFQLQPDRYNPGGYFQRKDVVELNRSLILSMSGSIAAPPPPQAILATSHRNKFLPLDMSWTHDGRPFGVKDPRFCATLLAWRRCGPIADVSLRIIRVRRNPSATAKSCVKHNEVGSFCEYNLKKAQDMAVLYDQYADWHCTNLAVPVYIADYDRIISKPESAVGELAEFVGVRDRSAIKLASGRIGKNRAIMQHYLRKFSSPGLVLNSAKKTLTKLVSS